jgi:HPt (histidine-containing phosphotransfer) domain-containing protein
MEAQVIDQAALDNLLETTGGDPAFLVELIDIYLTDSVGLLATMRQAVSGANAVELRRAAHSLKSNSASFGAGRLAGLCQELEDQARDEPLEGAAARLVHVEAAFVEVQRELRRVRGELTKR